MFEVISLSVKIIVFILNGIRTFKIIRKKQKKDFRSVSQPNTWGKYRIFLLEKFSFVKLQLNFANLTVSDIFQNKMIKQARKKLEIIMS